MRNHVAALNARPSTSTNDTVALAEVDVSLDPNAILFSRYAPAGVPTLLFFRRTDKLDSFEGPRTTAKMAAFIAEALVLARAPTVSLISSKPQLTAFLKRAGPRPVAISVFHPNAHLSFPARIPLPRAAWHQIARNTSLEGLDRPLILAAVQAPSLIYTNSTRYAIAAKSHSVPPVLAVAYSADRFFDLAHWYFPGLKDAPSLAAYVHANALPPGRYTTLTHDNAPNLLAAGRTLALVFANSSEPPNEAEDLLYEAATMKTEPPLLTLYVDVEQFPDLVDFVKLKPLPSPKAVKQTTKGDTKDDLVEREKPARLVIFREVNGGHEVLHAPAKQTTSWMHSTVTNLSSVPASVAGKVSYLKATDIPTLMRLERRVVALLVTTSRGWRARRAVDGAAKLLRVHSGMLRVASVDLEKGSLPTELVEKAKGLPATLVCGIGGQPDEIYRGSWRARAVARFVRECAEIEGGWHDDSFFWRDVAAAYLFTIGFTLFFVGWYLRFQRTRRRKQSGESTRQKHG